MGIPIHMVFYSLRSICVKHDILLPHGKRKRGRGEATKLAHLLEKMEIALKIIEAGVYSDFRRTADTSIYPSSRVNWHTNIIIFSCHVLVIF